MVIFFGYTLAMHLKTYSKGRKGRLYSSLGLVALLIIATVVYFNHVGEQPVTDTINSPSVALPTRPSSQTENLTTPYFTTLLPAGWKQSPTSAAGRVSVLALGPADTAEQIAIVSDVLPSGGLNGVADYNLRKNDTATYTVLRATGLPAGSITFQSTTGGLNDTLFMVEAGRYASLSVSAGDPQTAISLLKTVSQQWSWR